MEGRQTYAPFTYFTLTFLLSWLVWVPCALDHVGWLPFSLPNAVVAFAGLGTLGPAVAAVLVSYRQGRGAGVRSLLGQLGHVRAGWRWFAASALVFPALLLVAGGLYTAFGGAPRLMPDSVTASGLLVLGVMLAVTVLGEEAGWRGYALPALQARWNALGASLILGTVTTVWHIPFWIPQPSFDQYGWGYFGLNWLWILAATIFLTWIMNNSRNSVLLAVLFHWCVNILNVGILPVTGLIHSFEIAIGLSWVLVAGIVIVYGPKRLVQGAQTDTRLRAGAAN